jgi:phage-related protein
VRFAACVYVLHCFQKKSTKGVATPQHEIALIRRRLQMAETDHARRAGKGGQKP